MRNVPPQCRFQAKSGFTRRIEAKHGGIGAEAGCLHNACSQTFCSWRYVSQRGRVALLNAHIESPQCWMVKRQVQWLKPQSPFSRIRAATPEVT